MMTTIRKALNLVMADVGAVKKLDHNSSGTGFNFRGIDAVTNAVYPALVKHGVIIAPKVIAYEYGTVVVGRNRTEMGHVRLTVEFTWYGPEDDHITTIAAGEAFDSGDKATAKAHSVAFRTTLLQTLCLPTDEPDPDSHSYERSEAPVRTDMDDALAELGDACAGLDLNPTDVAAKFFAIHKKPPRQATAEQVREFITSMHGQEPA
jgi:hypothetical protein